MSRFTIGRWSAFALAAAGSLAFAEVARAQYYRTSAGTYARAGSIRYATPTANGTTAVRTTGTVATPTGSVRYSSGPYGATATTAAGTTIHTTYGNDYVARFPPGYRTVNVNGAPSAVYPRLPAGSTRVTVGGTQYYTRNNVYFQPYNYRGQWTYRVVTPPR